MLVVWLCIPQRHLEIKLQWKPGGISLICVWSLNLDAAKHLMNEEKARVMLLWPNSNIDLAKERATGNLVETGGLKCIQVESTRSKLGAVVEHVFNHFNVPLANSTQAITHTPVDHLPKRKFTAKRDLAFPQMNPLAPPRCLRVKRQPAIVEFLNQCSMLMWPMSWSEDFTLSFLLWALHDAPNDLSSLPVVDP